jgi:endonuclease YncB( thermonuclease family)
MIAGTASRRVLGHACAFVLLFLTNLLRADTIGGRVVRVSDGDTITVLAPGNRQIHVRLAWIDAPEKVQSFANVSRESLGELVAGRTARVIERDVDRYGRTVGTVEIDGRDVNKEQLRRGLAWVYAEAPAETQREYRKVQEVARSERKGLWSEKDQVPPWKWRKIRETHKGNRQIKTSDKKQPVTS